MVLILALEWVVQWVKRMGTVLGRAKVLAMALKWAATLVELSAEKTEFG